MTDNTITPVTFTSSNQPALIVLPNTFPNAVTAGETLGTVLARINAYRAPTRQIVGAICPKTGHHIPLNTPITGRMVVEEVVAGQYLQFGPTQYAALALAKAAQLPKSDGPPPTAGLPVPE